jgi:hypothetical protein
MSCNMTNQSICETVSTGGVTVNQAVIQGERDYCELLALVVTYNGVAIPIGTKIDSVEGHGYSAWTTTAKVSAILPDQDLRVYFFLKVQSHLR